MKSQTHMVNDLAAASHIFPAGPGRGAASFLQRSFACFLLFLLGCSLASAATVTYTYTDAQGSVLAEADSSGNITAAYDYRPYGSAYAGAGMSSGSDGVAYTGHVSDADTSLIYMQARYFDPAIGRFVSPDPVTPGPGNTFNFNIYSYANNNPIVNVDLDGRCTGSNIQHGDGSCFGGSGGFTTFGYSLNFVQPAESQGGNKQAPPQSQEHTSQLLIGAAKGMLDETKDWPVIGDDAGALPQSPSNADQAKGMVAGSLIVRIATALATDGESAEGNLVSFGKTENQLAHTFRHVDAAGMDLRAVTNGIRGDLQAGRSHLTGGLNKRSIQVGGKTIDYHAYKQPDGSISVGRITTPKATP